MQQHPLLARKLIEALDELRPALIFRCIITKNGTARATPSGCMAKQSPWQRGCLPWWMCGMP
jgi:hypothetical protein